MNAKQKFKQFAYLSKIERLFNQMHTTRCQNIDVS